MIPILYDGWPLCYSPNSPGALHTLTLLEVCSEEFEPILALPAPPPNWLSEEISILVEEMENTPPGRLLWEQRRLPRLARQVGAKLVHLTSQSAPLLAPVTSVISPAGFFSPHNAGRDESIQDGWDSARPGGLIERLHRSLSHGTQERVLALFWPKDLPYYENIREPPYLKKLPPVVHPAFLVRQTQGVVKLSTDLPEIYLLYPGPYTRYSINNLLQAWSWAAGPIGDSCPLVMAGVAEDVLKPLGHMLRNSGLGDSIRVLPTLPPVDLASLYHGCKGLFYPGQMSIWEGPLRYGLYSGRAIIGSQSPLAEALLGPAAYLVPDHDFRSMGAALITVAVEEEMEERLAQAARERSADWELGSFREELILAYREFTEAI
jgi:glycosyltransferase involved in cell wall biosynthesis